MKVICKPENVKRFYQRLQIKSATMGDLTCINSVVVRPRRATAKLCVRIFASRLSDYALSDCA